MRVQAVFAACLAGAATARGLGQSFNVDCDTASAGAPGIGLPPNTFGGAAAQPGFWNGLVGANLSSTPSRMNDVSGSATIVTLTRAFGTGGNFSSANAQTSGDFALLMEDGDDLAAYPAPGNTYTISNLAAGTYAMYVYAWAPDFPQVDFTVVSVNGSPSQTIGGGLLPANNTFQLGITHGVFSNLAIAAGGTITIVADGAPGSLGTINGFQIKQLPGGGCDGDTDGDNDVDTDDLVNVVLQWGTVCPCTGDVDGDSDVDTDDLVIVVLNWGRC